VIDWRRRVDQPPHESVSCLESSKSAAGAPTATRPRQLRSWIQRCAWSRLLVSRRRMTLPTFARQCSPISPRGSKGLDRYRASPSAVHRSQAARGVIDAHLFFFLAHDRVECRASVVRERSSIRKVAVFALSDPRSSVRITSRPWRVTDFALRRNCSFGAAAA